MTRLLLDQKVTLTIATFLFTSAMIAAPVSSLILNAKGYPLAGEGKNHILTNPFTPELHYEEAKHQQVLKKELLSQTERKRAHAIQTLHQQHVLAVQDVDGDNLTRETDLAQFDYWLSIANNYPQYKDAQLLAALFALRRHRYEDVTIFTQKTEELSDPESDAIKLIETIKAAIPQKL